MRHEIPSRDPDLEQAIDDLLPVARVLRSKSARLIGEQNEIHRRAITADARDLYARIALRAERIGTTGPALVELLNILIDSQARRGKPAPAGDTSRTLLTRTTEAFAREEAAHAALTDAQAELKAATQHRLTMEHACEAFGVKRIRQ